MKGSVRRLLDLAERERDRLRRHLLVAAALRELLEDEPIVVGGTAEEFWSAGEYHETDLDICVPLTSENLEALREAGFERRNRHWVRPGLPVAVEIPESYIDGDVDRAVREPVGPGVACIIGVDDLYLDRLRQTTVRESLDDIHFQSALAVAVSCHSRIDWRYVHGRIAATREAEPLLAAAMKRMDGRIRRRVRRALSSPGR